MKKIDAFLHEHGLSHQHVLNKAIHWICVPLIFFSIVCLLWSVPSGLLSAPFGGTAAEFANRASLLPLLMLLTYCLVLSLPLFTGMLLFSALCLPGAWGLDHYASIPLWVIALYIFVLAWIGQLYGHKLEGKKARFSQRPAVPAYRPCLAYAFYLYKIGA